MKLKDYLKDKKSTVWAREAGIPVPVITRFLRGERGISPRTMQQIVTATKGNVTFDDLLEEMGI